MASPLQQAAVRRKVVYVAVIIALFTLSIFWRGGRFSVPLASPARAQLANELRRLDPDSRTRVLEKLQKGEEVEGFSSVAPAPSGIHAVADWLESRTIESQAAPTALDLRELDQGDPEIAGTSARLALTGARGFAVMMLWRAAIEKQKRNEWHQLELLVRAVTRLQPNFLTPWLYQSWNLTYNVSVENDRLGDTYFYIARGIELLAEGERLNRNSPDMRYWTGMYYQNKFSVSDKVDTMRSLMHLSNIPPDDRKPTRFKKPNGEFDAAQFQDFCRKNPQFVRRLRTSKLGLRRPEEVVQFLEDNQKVPTRFDAENRLLPPTVQFPVLPPGVQGGEFDPTDEFDAFHAARSWFEYAQLVVPPPSAEPLGYFELAGDARFKYRMPRSPALIIFRYHPARAQSYLAERLGKEGWIDESSRWDPDERADADDERWFPKPPAGKTTEGLATVPTSLSAVRAWDGANERWRQFGTQNGMLLDQVKLARLEQDARGMSPELLQTLSALTDEQLAARGMRRDQLKAAATLRAYGQNRQMTNFAFFLAQSEAEKSRKTGDARKTLFAAERAAEDGKKVLAIELYARGIAQWRAVLAEFPNYHHQGGSDRVEEDAYEMFLPLVQLLDGSEQVTSRVGRQMDVMRVLGPFDDASVRQTLRSLAAEDEAGYLVSAADQRIAARAADLKLVPADVTPGTIKFANLPAIRDLVGREFPWLAVYTTDLKQEYWVNPDTRRSVRERKGLSRPPTPPPEAAPPGGPPGG